MRMFLNAIFDYNPKDKAFVTVPPILKEVLGEGGWAPERLLFDLYDINGASTEGRTPHAMLMKRYSQLRPYWHNTAERFAATNHRPICSNTPIPPTSPHGYGFFSNFPGRKEGMAVFWPDDPAIDMDGAVFPWEMRGKIADKLAYVRPCFDDWCKSGMESLMVLYRHAQKSQPDKLVSAKALAKRFVAINGFARHDLCRWDDYGWYKRLPHGYWLYLILSINPTARYAGPVKMGLICYGVNFRIKYSCSPHKDFGTPRDTPADESAFQVFQAALDRFQEEMIPQLAEVFGETPETFYQHSHVFEFSGEFDV